jgi:cell fate regulator YaaT (PSP1 superfamily)
MSIQTCILKGEPEGGDCVVRVVGVRFKKAGKVYYFDPVELPVTPGCKVIVETARGIEYGDVAIGPKDVDEAQVVQPLKRVIRLGTDADAVKVAENKKREKEAFVVAQRKVDEHALDMNLVDVEYTFDTSKVIFYFTAEGRIDFRELVKDLAAIFRARIEMRQIGVRDEAKLLGGIGPCGRILCCTSFLGDFAPVSIRMAKDQNLSLNPSKISGLCGRLMCCLRYEQETYEEAKKDPTLAPSYVRPPAEVVAAYVAEDLEDEPVARPNWWKTESGMGARIAQAVAAPERGVPERPSRPAEGPKPHREEGSRPQGKPPGGQAEGRTETRQKQGSRPQGQRERQGGGRPQGLPQGQPQGQGARPQGQGARPQGQGGKPPVQAQAQQPGQAQGAPPSGRTGRRRRRNRHRGQGGQGNQGGQPQGNQGGQPQGGQGGQPGGSPSS